MPYQFGSLWWGRDDLIHDKQHQFVERGDRIGHPLLSVKRDDLRSRQDLIPMLFGTSGTNHRGDILRRCVQVSGLTPKEPEHVCYFGFIVEPGMYSFSDLLDGIVHKQHTFRCPKKTLKDSPDAMPKRRPWYELRVMHPNEDKPNVDPSERKNLESFCAHHGL